jgi:hypothetical protein
MTLSLAQRCAELAHRRPLMNSQYVRSALKHSRPTIRGRENKFATIGHSSSFEIASREAAIDDGFMIGKRPLEAVLPTQTAT